MGCLPRCEVLCLPKFNLVLLIHAHQPVGNFDDVMERTYEHSYLPFVECLARHPRVRLGLHYTGSLLEWMAEKHPEYIQRIGTLVARGQVEIVGGGFYEPILIAIPYEDRIEQIRRLSDFVYEHFGKRPIGAWLAERVWEPQLPAALAEAGVEYTLVDDSHFLRGRVDSFDLFGAPVLFGLLAHQKAGERPMRKLAGNNRGGNDRIGPHREAADGVRLHIERVECGQHGIAGEQRAFGIQRSQLAVKVVAALASRRKSYVAAKKGFPA